MPIPYTKPVVTIDGNLSDWVSSEKIDYNDVPGFSLYATQQNSNYIFALSGSTIFGTGTTFWFNTDLNTATGFNIFGLSTGADYNVTIAADGTASLYTGSAGQTLVTSGLQIAYSADHQTLEFAVSAATLGNPTAINTLYQVNSAVYGPSDYTAQPYVAFGDSGIVPTTTATRIGIVYSATSAANYFSLTAYNDLVMSAQNQAIAAGVPFDLLTEADLTNVSKLADYTALVFPDFTNVQSTQLTAITNALLQVTRQFGVGLVTSGDFMTNDQTGAALGADPYGRMKMFFDATRVAGGNPTNVAIYSSDASQTVFKEVTPGALITDYASAPWEAFQSVSGTALTVATQVVDGQTYAAALASQGTGGGKNVLFSTNGVMADHNLLGEAIAYATRPAGLTVKLELTRFEGIVAARMDMDQSQFPAEVSPVDSNGLRIDGIYDKLIPILQQWKQTYNFVGSYYVNIGDNPNAADPSSTNWTSSLPYYQSILAMGGEIGTHSLTHLINPPTTTFTAATSTATAAHGTQITLNNVPALNGVTVGMVVSGLNLGANTPLPGAAGEGGAVANTFVTAVSGNTITINYFPGGYGTSNVGTLGAIPAGTTLTFSIPPENTNFLGASTSTVLSATGNPFTYAYEFGQGAALLSNALGVPVYGAAVPGATETAATSAGILQYFPSVAATATSSGYTGYVTGGWTGIGSGYPGAFGYLDPSNTNSIYLAPNLTFDFSLIQYQGKTIAQAQADWQAQMDNIAAYSAGPPIYIWPIHDYGVTAWDTSGSGLASPYTTQLFTDFIANATAEGDEFVTLEELASRIANFAASGVTQTVNGNVITATVAAGHAGDFALSVANQGSQIIQNVGTWYAYDTDDVFLPNLGGTFNITMGTIADAVTHIDALPMRADLLSVTGDGVNLAFSVVGDGTVEIITAPVGNATPVVTGASIANYVGNVLKLGLAGLGQHDVTVTFEAPPTEVVSSVAFSNDSGASTTDLITNIAAQTISGTLNAPLVAGHLVKVSLDNGVTWRTATASAGGTTFSLAGVTLTAGGTSGCRSHDSQRLPAQRTASSALCAGPIAADGDRVHRRHDERQRLGRLHHQPRCRGPRCIRLAVGPAGRGRHAGGQQRRRCHLDRRHGQRHRLDRDGPGQPHGELDHSGPRGRCGREPGRPGDPSRHLRRHTTWLAKHTGSGRRVG